LSSSPLSPSQSSTLFPYTTLFRSQNTIFIFTADHTLNSLPSENLKEQFHIPLIVYSPDGSLPAKRESQFASQYDLLPTMLDLLGDRKSTRLNSSHVSISYAVFGLK